MAYPLHGGWRVAGPRLPKLTSLLADGFAIVMAVLTLFAGGVTSRGEDLPQSVVLDFTATWCQPCQEMSPIVHRLIQQGYAIRKVDVDQQKRLAQSFGVATIPTFVLIVDGEERTRVSGRISEAQLRRMAQQATPPARQQPETYLAQPEANRSIPLPKTSKETRNPTASDEVTPFQQSLGESKAAPEIKPVAVADSKERAGLLGKLKFPKFGSKRDKTKVASASPADETPQFRGQSGEIEEPSDEPSPPREPLSASVRLRVIDETGVNLGSGTIIDSRVGRTTIITCGHIFGSRDASAKVPAGAKQVEVDLFLPGGRHETYVGKVVDYDLDGDVGVVTITTAGTLPISPLAPLSEIPAVRDRLVSIGCGGGELPTQEPVRVTAVNRYDGPDTLECTGVPVQGRSGGGLFDPDGQLVGVCFGADQDGQRGVYASLRPIHDVLTRAGLQQLAPVTPPVESATEELATDATTELADAEASSASQLPQDANFTEAFRELDRDLFADETPPSSEQLAELFKDSPDAEVICIVRSKQGGPDRVVILNQASTKFVSYLLDSVDTQRTTAPQTASLRREDAADRLGGDWVRDDSLGVPKQAADVPRLAHPGTPKPSRTKSSNRSKFGSRSAN